MSQDRCKRLPAAGRGLPPRCAPQRVWSILLPFDEVSETPRHLEPGYLRFSSLAYRPQDSTPEDLETKSTEDDMLRHVTNLHLQIQNNSAAGQKRKHSVSGQQGSGSTEETLEGLVAGGGGGGKG